MGWRQPKRGKKGEEKEMGRKASARWGEAGGRGEELQPAAKEKEGENEENQKKERQENK